MIKQNRLKAYLMSLVLCAVTTTSTLVCNTGTIPVISPVEPVAQTEKTPTERTSEDYFYKLLTNLKTISYDADKIVIPLPQLSYEIVVNLQCKRSGDLFTPLQAPSIQVHEKASESGEKTPNNITDLVVGLVKNSLKDKAAEQFEQLPIIKALWQFETPQAAFIIKLILLCMEYYQNKHTLLNAVQSAEFYNEIFRLLFRLSNTHINTSTLSTNKLSACLPEVVQAWIQTEHPNIINLVDDVWMALFLNSDNIAAIDTHKHASLTLNMMVFNDNSLAQKAFEKYKDYTGANIIDSVQGFIKSTDMIDWYSFHPYQEIKNLYSKKDLSSDSQGGKELNTSTIRSPYQCLIGTKVCPFEDLDKNIQNVLPKLKQQVLQESQLPKNMVLTDIHGRTWIVQATNKFGGIQTLKQCAITLIKTFKKYQGLKQALPEETKITATKNTELDLPKNIEILALQKKLEETSAHIDAHRTLLENKNNNEAFTQSLLEQVKEEKTLALTFEKKLKTMKTKQMVGRIISRTFELNPEFKHLFENIMDNTHYGPIKNDMLHALRLIAKHSLFMQKHKNVCNHIMQFLSYKIGLPALSE